MGRRSKRIIAALSAGILAAWLAGCTTTTSVTSVDTSALEERALAAAQAGDGRTAADLYTQLAGMSGGTARVGYLSICR